MLQTRFVFFTENFTIHRYSNTFFLRWTITVSSCTRAVPARSSSGFFVIFQMSQFGSSGKREKKHCACQLARLCLVAWTYSATHGRSVDSSSELISSGVSSSQLQVVPPRHCVSREFTREAFFERLKPLWNLMRPVSQCLDMWEMQSVSPCKAWVLLLWDIGLKNFSRLVS